MERDRGRERERERELQRRLVVLKGESSGHWMERSRDPVYTGNRSRPMGVIRAPHAA
ncbi:MAG: hypothetical protein JWR01_2938 [Subtercola sp.]|nr:hypothetical protein [Subtercola sp.]